LERYFKLYRLLLKEKKNEAIEPGVETQPLLDNGTSKQLQKRKTKKSKKVTVLDPPIEINSQASFVNENFEVCNVHVPIFFVVRLIMRTDVGKIKYHQVPGKQYSINHQILYL
jgi:hypothetical protein